MEKEYLVKRGDKETVVSETLAKKLGHQVQVLGEVKQAWVTNGEEKLTPQEFAQKHISYEQSGQSGHRARRVDKGFKTVYEIDKNSKPGVVRRPGEAYHDHTILDHGREIPFEQWRRQHTSLGR